MASKEAIAEVLDEAIALIEHGWTKRQYWRHKNEGISYCAVGAIKEVVARLYPNHDFKIRHGMEKAAVLAVARVYGVYRGTQYDEAVRAVTNWNDHTTTTRNNVTRRFRIAKKQVLKTKGAP